MGKHQYKKLEPAHIRGICVVCNKNPQKKIGSKEKYMVMCSQCNHRLYASSEVKAKAKARAKEARHKTERPYRSSVGNSCEQCKFVAEHPCQLDVDHIDEDHSNNDPSNLQTLCANCHRLKTLKARKPQLFI